MEKIASFTVNHLNLKPGLYVSRRDKNIDVVTTFDLRFTAPNVEPVMDNAGLHTIEHLGATFLRNSYAKDDVIYFGPMGCRTGFYLVMFGELNSIDVFGLVVEILEFIVNHDGEIPGAKPEECGNYSDQDLDAAKKYAKKYLIELVDHKRMEYPQ